MVLTVHKLFPKVIFFIVHVTLELKNVLVEYTFLFS